MALRAQADPESLRWSLELALRSQNFEQAALIREAIPAAEMESPVAALDSLVRDIVQQAIHVAQDSSASPKEQEAALGRLQELASAPAASEEAEDGLFLILRTAPNDVAAMAEAALWAAWLPSGDEAVDAATKQGLRLMAAGELEKALFAFTEVVEAAPDFPEGWNKRATVHFLLKRLDESMEDCLQVLALKPRHFGCLSGLGLCHLRKGEEREATRYMRQALEVNPRSKDMQRIVGEIQARAAFMVLSPRVLEVLSVLRGNGPLATGLTRSSSVRAAPAAVKVRSGWTACSPGHGQVHLLL